MTAGVAKKHSGREALPLAMCVAEVLASELADTFRQAYELNLRQSHKSKVDCQVHQKNTGYAESIPCIFLVELARVELASENHLTQLSP